MKIYALICTRSADYSVVTAALIKQLKEFGISVKVLANQKSIFKAYKKALLRKDNKSTLLVEYGDYYNKP